jgi:hypothetical protein
MANIRHIRLVCKRMAHLSRRHRVGPRKLFPVAQVFANTHLFGVRKRQLLQGRRQGRWRRGRCKHRRHRSRRGGDGDEAFRRCRRTCRGRGGCRTTRCRVGRAAPAVSGLPTLRHRLASLEGLRSRSLPSLPRLPTHPLGSPQLVAHQSVSVPVLCQRAVQWTVCGVPTRLHVQLYRSRFVIGLLVSQSRYYNLTNGSISELVVVSDVGTSLRHSEHRI